MLYVYDKEAIAPTKIPFEWVRHEIIAWTRHGGVPVWGYRFLDINKRIVWECPEGYAAGELAIRFAKRRDRFIPAEDSLNWGLIWFDKVCKDEGIEFDSAREKYQFYEDFRKEHLEETGFDFNLFGKSRAYINMVRSGPGARKDNPKPSGASDGNGS